MTTLIADCETNGLLRAMTRLWTIQIGDAETDEVTVYCDCLPGYPSLREGAARLKAADRVVFHNGMGFDFHAINRIYPGTLRVEQILDTLVLARLLNPEERKNSLADWGERLGVPKGTAPEDWTTWSEDRMPYARQDIIVGRRLFNHVWPKVRDLGSCVDTEHRFAFIMSLQEQNGFTLNLPAAWDLEGKLRAEQMQIEQDLQAVFPPIWARQEKGEFTPKRDNRKMGYTAGAPFTKVAMEIFNPGSRPQIAARLLRLGWKPLAYTENGAPKVDETTLNDLPYPQAKPLVRYLTVQKYLGQLSDGDNGWLKLVDSDGRVRGRVNTIGCAPGRCSHFKPNMAQVTKKDKRMRAVWKARDGWKLVGCDGEGLQARVCAHYLSRYDKGVFADRVANGRKEDGSDIHSVNRKALAHLGLSISPAADPEGKIAKKLRDGAKRCLYCVWFGGSDKKLGWTLKAECRNSGVPVPAKADVPLGKMARRALFAAITGFEDLSTAIQARAKERGHLIGIDGRIIPIRSSHSALVFLMQAGETAVMKRAQVIFHFEKAPEAGWVHGVDYAYCASVHDEVQIEARPQIAEDVGKTFAWCITEAGRRLGLRCPLAGDYAVGDDWAGTH